VVSKPILNYTGDDFDHTMAVNVRSAFLLGQAAARGMIADGINGHLVFTTSWVAETPWPGISAYNASKAAMNQLMRSFARELADRGVRANAIAPGIVGVGMAKRQWDTEPDYRARAGKAIPLGALQTVESVVDAFIFICSAAAAYMTGAVLTVDGGCSLYPMD
jgi:NAD(P)-dependent dehydrogenase (short-subunit alcohol dehydrogenase family)